jgi:hypothetical protein
MSKISELSDGGVIQGGDTLIAVRSGGNVKVTYGGSTTANIDGGTIDGTVIGGTTPAAGSFTTLTASGDVNFDSGTLFVDESTSRVGIGITSPSAKLEVRTNVTAATDLDPTAIKLFNSSDGGSAIEFSNAVSGNSKISFGVDGTGGSTDDTNLIFSTGVNTALNQRVRIASGGDVSFYEDTGTTPKFFWDASAESLGIGTSSPASLLQVLGSFGLSNAAMSSSGTSGDFTISISGLTGLTGGFWRKASVLVCYSGINSDQTNSTTFLSLINIWGLSTWGIESTNNILGTTSVTASSGASSSLNLDFDVADGNFGRVFAIVVGSGGNISISG